MSAGGAGDLYNILGPDRAPIGCATKAIASGEGFATLERWLGQADALFLRRDRGDPLVHNFGRDEDMDALFVQQVQILFACLHRIQFEILISVDE
jgi:hypothetical protein